MPKPNAFEFTWKLSGKTISIKINFFDNKLRNGLRN